MKTKHVLFILIVLCITACGNAKKQSLAESTLKPAQNLSDSIQGNPVIEDTTIYIHPATTATISNYGSYFSTNNKFNNWDKRNKKSVGLRAIVEKDGRLINLRIVRSCGIKKLDEEAIRLIQTAKITPASNELGKPVRSDWVMFVPFPSK